MITARRCFSKMTKCKENSGEIRETFCCVLTLMEKLDKSLRGEGAFSLVIPGQRSVTSINNLKPIPSSPGHWLAGWGVGRTWPWVLFPGRGGELTRIHIWQQEDYEDTIITGWCEQVVSGFGMEKQSWFVIKHCLCPAVYPPQCKSNPSLNSHPWEYLANQ